MAQILLPEKVWDGTAADYFPSETAILVENGKIKEINSRARLGTEAKVVSLDGLTAIPGLIDAHVHLSLDPESPVADAEDPDGAVLRAEAMVRRGITTARDLGSSGGRILELRKEINKGERIGPRLLVAGPPLTTPGGHCHFWGGVVEDAKDIEKLVRDQAELGFDWLKVMATGGVLTQGTRPSATQFKLKELEKIVSMSEAFGLPVAAHCHGTPGIAACARARVQSIEHSSFSGEGGFGSAFDEEVSQLISESGAFVAPTVHARWSRFLTQYNDNRPISERTESTNDGSDFARRMNRCYRGLKAAGVRMVASTDAGIPGVHHDALDRALPVWARFAELSPREALISATSGSASALGISDETGFLKPGRSADIVAVRGDPLKSLDCLADKMWVMARGQVVTQQSEVFKAKKEN